MIIEKDPYYSRPEVSNSDLTWLKKYSMPENQIIDVELAYRFGTLIDCMITEPHKINYFTFQCAGNQYTKEEFKLAEEMKRSFYRDEFCRKLVEQSAPQKVSIQHGFRISLDNFQFALDVRCKWDLFVNSFDMSADIKSTACTTQKQFEDSIRYFEYDRQSAWYMDIEKRRNHMLIGISKKNLKIFKVPVKAGESIYNNGKALYQDLGFKWWTLFSN
jgi:hypothetical protein